MLTNLEQRTLSLVNAALKKYLSEDDKWEQRRYETARDILAHNAVTSGQAIMLANELIKLLKSE